MTPRSAGGGCWNGSSIRIEKSENESPQQLRRAASSFVLSYCLSVVLDQSRTASSAASARCRVAGGSGSPWRKEEGRTEERDLTREAQLMQLELKGYHHSSLATSSSSSIIKWFAQRCVSFVCSTTKNPSCRKQDVLFSRSAGAVLSCLSAAAACCCHCCFLSGSEFLLR